MLLRHFRMQQIRHQCICLLFYSNFFLAIYSHFQTEISAFTHIFGRNWSSLSLCYSAGHYNYLACHLFLVYTTCRSYATAPLLMPYAPSKYRTGIVTMAKLRNPTIQRIGQWPSWWLVAAAELDSVHNSNIRASTFTSDVQLFCRQTCRRCLTWRGLEWSVHYITKKCLLLQQHHRRLLLASNSILNL